MKVTVLTSSRADYSIYYPLLKKLKNDSYFELSLIAFGTHLSQKFGYTVRQIENDGFQVIAIDTLPDGDSPADIAKSIGKTTIKFSDFWKQQADKTDLIICLGDRFEMFAAVSASIPFNMKVAHIHGGETTLGAMDNIYRHSLTHISEYHFASTENHVRRVAELKGTTENIFNVGSLGLESLSETKLLDAKAFKEKFGIPVDNPVLVTFHPETVDYAKNEQFARELVKALNNISRQVIITMPNADTMGNSIRKYFTDFAAQKSNVFTVESLGMQGYYSCLNLCSFVLGNSSSGIIEAASFGKYAINLGNRQKGRDAGKNVIHCEISADKIGDTIESLKSMPQPGSENIYWGGEASEKIIKILKGIIPIRSNSR